MKRYLAVFVGLLVAACSASHGTEEDAEIAFDAGSVIFRDADMGRVDGGIDPVGDPVCGNSIVERGEQCDDGGTSPGDGCDASCQREPYCGDGNMDPGEVCDDGNNRSGDDCRSDCLSNEECGNGVLDPHVGEACDPSVTGMESCLADCTSVMECGDGTPSGPAPACDDGNTMAWDGCGATCLSEQALAVTELSLAASGVGCDLNGDGTVDNAFARALGPLLVELLNTLVTANVGDLGLLLGMLGLEDRSAANDNDFRIAVLQADDGPSPGQFVVNPSSFDAMGRAITVQSRVAAHDLVGGPEDIPLPLPIPSINMIELADGHIEGTTVAQVPGDGELTGITDGLLCGGAATSIFNFFNMFSDMIEFDPPCDGGAPPEMLDVIIGGGTITIAFGGAAPPLTFTATPPDLDLDGDGLEGFSVYRAGRNCQPVVVSCTDGDGTAIPGRGCFSDPRIADGYSMALPFAATRATIVAPTP